MELQPTAATVKKPAQNFTGDVYMNPIFNGDGTSRLVAALVRFTPGARTNWHSHANGRLLHCTDGAGLVATRDGTTIRIRPGDSVWTPAGEEHWHGRTADNVTDEPRRERLPAALDRCGTGHPDPPESPAAESDTDPVSARGASGPGPPKARSRAPTSNSLASSSSARAAFDRPRACR
jgi:quercetin dioxygenase-like cupin family protein